MGITVNIRWLIFSLRCRNNSNVTNGRHINLPNLNDPCHCQTNKYAGIFSHSIFTFCSFTPGDSFTILSPTKQVKCRMILEDMFTFQMRIPLIKSCI